MLAKIRLAEATSKKSSALTMFFQVPHGEDAQSREIGQLLIPDVLGVLGRHCMDLLELCNIRDSDLGR